jgi:Vam6/Vps39-like protein vacuolar protein sorting-associated protein 39
MQLDINHNMNDLFFRDADIDLVISYKLFRGKLQSFLQRPDSDFSAEKAVKALPRELLHEYALVVSKMGRHEEALSIYCHQLANVELAEWYCHRIYDQGIKDIYMSLIRTILNPSSDSMLVGFRDDRAGYNPGLLQLVVDLAERNYDRIDSTTFFEVVPKTAPLKMFIRYLSQVIELGTAKKRNLQVVHQLLRMREVNIRTTGESSASSASGSIL